jgi:hypothetical protein
LSDPTSLLSLRIQALLLSFIDASMAWMVIFPTAYYGA